MEGNAKEDKALQNLAHSSDDSEELQDHGQSMLLNSKATTSNKRDNAVTERVKAFLMEYMSFIKQNKRNVAAGVCLWISFVIAHIAYSMLAPFFPEEVQCLTLVYCLEVTFLFCNYSQPCNAMLHAPIAETLPMEVGDFLVLLTSSGAK